MERFYIPLIIHMNLAYILCGVATPTYFYILRAGPCHGIENLVVNVSEMSISKTGDLFSLSGGFDVTEDVADGWNIKASIQKCQDIRNLDTCDFFKSFPVVSLACDEYAAGDVDLLNYVLNCTEPRLTCPIKAGSYKLKECQFGTDSEYFTLAEAKISTSLFGYTLRVHGYNQDINVFCIDVHLQLMYKNTREKVPDMVPEGDGDIDEVTSERDEDG